MLNPIGNPITNLAASGANMMPNGVSKVSMINYLDDLYLEKTAGIKDKVVNVGKDIKIY